MLINIRVKFYSATNYYDELQVIAKILEFQELLSNRRLLSRLGERRYRHMMRSAPETALVKLVEFEPLNPLTTPIDVKQGKFKDLAVGKERALPR